MLYFTWHGRGSAWGARLQKRRERHLRDLTGGYGDSGTWLGYVTRMRTRMRDSDLWHPSVPPPPPCPCRCRERNSDDGSDRVQKPSNVQNPFHTIFITLHYCSDYFINVFISMIVIVLNNLIVSHFLTGSARLGWGNHNPFTIIFIILHYDYDYFNK